MKQLLTGILLMVVLIVHTKQVHAARLDSLKDALPTMKDDSNKVALFIEIAYVQSVTDIKASNVYAKQGLQLAEQLHWVKGICDAQLCIGSNYRDQGDFVKALEIISAELELAKANNLGKLAGYLTMGTVYEMEGNYPKGLESYFAALKEGESMHSQQGIAECYNAIGGIYDYLQDCANALKYYSAALDLTRKANDKSRMSNICSNIGMIYVTMGAKEGRKSRYYDTALTNFHNAIELIRQTAQSDNIAKIYDGIAKAYCGLERYPEAIKYATEALKVFETAGNTASIVDIYNVLGRIYTMSQQFQLAEDYLQKSIALAKEQSNLGFLGEGYGQLEELYTAWGKYPEALKAFRLYSDTQDSLLNSENAKKIVATQLQYDFDKKAAVARVELRKQKQLRNGFVVGFGVVLLFSVVVVRQRNKVTHERNKVALEKKRSDELLLNILPAEVADELKVSGSAAAQLHDNTTVIFTDFVNFTVTSEEMNPKELIDELHACFKAFDEIVGKYGIEKIKTIGDAYLAVAGLPKPMPDHAHRVVMAAKEITSFMAERRAKMGNKTFEIRVGIHTGKVVAGIVGIKKFAYDIWGDTVNTAARMEQNSQPGRINISAVTYELVKDDFTCTYRGEIAAKNKGNLSMYFVD